jgi:hypothetical protein
MKEVPSVFTFGIGALCFVMFVTVFKPNAISAVPGPSKPEYCNTKGSPTHPCPLNVFASAVAHAEVYVRLAAVAIEPSLRQ